jgi:hypothetical protein
MSNNKIEMKFPPCGIIIEFKKMAQAEAFAAAVKGCFGLSSRVFDDAEAAARSHAFPWAQNPPVVHVDRPFWALQADVSQSEWDRAWKVEREIDQLAKEFGGTFVGT